MSRPKKPKRLTSNMLQKKFWKSMRRYDKLNFLESYAMFMGRVQVVEFALKKILRRKYRYGYRKLEKMTLGGAIAELGQKGLRPDFVCLLKELNKHRINMAHEFLADHFHLVSLRKDFGHLSMKPLRHAIWKVEETIQVFDHLNEYRMFFKRQRIAY